MKLFDYLMSFTLLFIVIFLNGCGPHESSTGPKVQHGKWGVDTQWLSDSIAPGDNFYEYVNEGWRKNTQIPPGHSIYSAPWVAQGQVDEQLNKLITSMETSVATTGPARRVRDFYTSFMNSDAIENRELSVIENDLHDILSITTYEEVSQWMGDPRASSIFHLLVQPPVTMQGGYILTLAQYRVTGLGLPGQVYYKSDQAPYPDHRKNYEAYIATTLQRAGIANPEKRAKNILELERRYANVMWDFARLRDAGAAFNMIPLSSLNTYAPGFPWQEYMSARGITKIDSINVGVGALRESAMLFRQISVEDWASFLAFHWINDHADLLPEAFSTASFKFYDAGLWGVEEREPHSERAIKFVKRQLTDDVGAIYVEEHFPPSRQKEVEGIVEYIRRAFKEKLEKTEWMDEVTREEAQAKLDNIIVEVGAPQAGIDWSKLETKPDDLFGNYARLQHYRWAAQLARIGQPITRYGDWNMGPHAIGMGYHQQYNKIFITAGALLPPFFDPEADPAVNFGAVGQTIGHEFGHALDDQGSKFDSKGILRNWWSDASREAYEAKTRGLIEQFKHYEPLPGVHLAADQMIGEIVGDLVGTSIAYRAYELYSEDHYGGDAHIFDGFTGAQRFFLGTTQQTRTMATDDTTREIALHETHPPAEFRINGILRNLEEWYTAFQLDEQAKLFLPENQRIRLW